jgi:prevent-host-death family protein
MLNVSLTEFESQYHQIFNRVEAGEEIIITRSGKPIIRLSSAVEKQNQALQQTNKHPENTDNLLMTREKLDYAVKASERILKEAAQGKLPRYV